jgi:triosephosphate isomerase
MTIAGTSPPLFVGVSLKMYFDHLQTLNWCEQVSALAAEHPAILSGAAELVVLPSSLALVTVSGHFDGTRVRLGAQDIFWEDRGPFTGEVGGAYLRQVGCSYAMMGHAERRRIFHEDDAIVAAKVDAAVRNNLTPILCVGEHEQMPTEQAAGVCIGQLQAALVHLLAGGHPRRIIVAYEPEWAIGAARPAGPSHIGGIGLAVKQWLESQEALSGSQFIYGGSAGPGLLTELGPAVDGLFLGRFAHDPEALCGIFDECTLLVDASQPRISR